jgi:hypothetical protein
MQARPFTVRSYPGGDGSRDAAETRERSYPGGGGESSRESLQKVRHKKTLKKTELCLFDMQNGSCPRGGGYPRRASQARARLSSSSRPLPPVQMRAASPTASTSCVT